jgi:O-antigen ligase
MTASTIAAGPARRARPPNTEFLPAAKGAEGRVERRAGLVWALLFLNVMPYTSTTALVPIPNVVGKVVAQSVLPVALLVALTINRRAAIRPNVFMCLLSLLALEAVFTAIGADYLKGTLFRTFRLVGFVMVLWLLTPYWGREKMLLVRFHMKICFGIVCTALVGLALSPHKALQGGRFLGIVWPVPATQLAHYAAVTIGLVVLLYLGGFMRGRSVTIIALVSLVVLLLTHTRTALLALVVGLVVACLSRLGSSPRVRKIFGITVVAAAVIYVTASAAITSWLTRGQSTQELTGLTGRTGFWGPLLAYPRDRFEMIFGFGISNGTFRGLPIDSNWLDSYQDQGLFGVVICAIIFLFLLIALCFQAQGTYRAIGLFLVVYCVVASFTEDGITNASPYMLDVTVAASLMMPYILSRRPSRNPLLALHPAAGDFLVDLCGGRGLGRPRMPGRPAHGGRAARLPLIPVQNGAQGVGDTDVEFLWPLRKFYLLGGLTDRHVADTVMI